MPTPRRSRADQATADVTARKADLDAEAARYKELYDSLSEQERQAAIEAASGELEAQAAAAAAAEAAAAAAAAGRSRTRPRRRADRAGPRPSGRRAAAEERARRRSRSQEPPSAPAGQLRGRRRGAAALSKVGIGYVYGAAGPNSFDCSGLTSWAWAQAGVSIPRTSGGQAGLPSVPLERAAAR